MTIESLASAKYISKHLYNIMFFVFSIFIASEAFGQDTANYTQEDVPFRWDGKIYADPVSGIKESVRNRIGDAPYRYPNLVSCQANEFLPEEDPFDVELRWAEFTSDAEVEVCLFRLFSELGTIDRIKTWIQNQGWHSISSFDYSRHATLYGLADNTTMTGINAYWDTERKGPFYGPEMIQQEMAPGTRSASLSIMVADDAGVFWVEVGHRSIWAK